MHKFKCLNIFLNKMDPSQLSIYPKSSFFQSALNFSSYLMKPLDSLEPYPSNHLNHIQMDPNDTSQTSSNYNYFELTNLTTSEQTSPFTSSQFDSIQWPQQALATGPLFIGENNNFPNITLPQW